jgi:hypothetical protein
MVNFFKVFISTLSISISEVLIFIRKGIAETQYIGVRQETKPSILEF